VDLRLLRTRKVKTCSSFGPKFEGRKQRKAHAQRKTQSQIQEQSFSPKSPNLAAAGCVYKIQQTNGTSRASTPVSEQRPRLLSNSAVAAKAALRKK
jgi:hypothetical protein